MRNGQNSKSRIEHDQDSTVSREEESVVNLDEIQAMNRTTEAVTMRRGAAIRRWWLARAEIGRIIINSTGNMVDVLRQNVDLTLEIDFEDIDRSTNARITCYLIQYITT